nr:PREDICTED: butyrophilin subfamily 2 member A2 [Anolis carolinensis]|eukprot:XP_008121772.1 PREDICTED: butyrophilin subfamily 2 member A2 [Anolis carolinensis]
MDQSGSRQELDPERSKNEAGTPQAPLLFLWCKIILGILLLGSIALKMAVILLLFSASQCKDKKADPVLLEKILDKSCRAPVFANVKFDPDTAHHTIAISKDLKNIPWQNLTWAVTNNPKRFDSHPCVLGREGFTSGSHWWEVEVVKGHNWALGVARESVSRKDNSLFREGLSYWTIEHYSASWNGINVPNYSSHMVQDIKKIRVVLNYSGGQVSFFNDSGDLLYKLQAEFLGEKVYPFFCTGSKTQLILLQCPSGK